MKSLFLVFSVILFIGCRPAIKDNEITKISFARMGAWSDPGAAISIDSSLTYNYYGKINKSESGYYSGKISASFWDTLNRKFKEIKYKTLDTTDNRRVQDGVYYEVIISWINGKRHILRYKDIKADSVLTVFNWLNDSYKSVKLYRSKNSIKFQTTFQNPLPTTIPGDTSFLPPTK